MSERFNYYDRPNRRRTVGWVVGAIAAAGSALGLVKCGPEALDKLDHIIMDDSAVVAGVHGQVEGHDYRRVFTGKMWIHKYWLAIEQCPVDVEAAKQGDSTKQSFNPAVDVVAPGCVVDWVRVSRGTYRNYSEGEVIYFDGEPTEQLLK